MPRFLRILFLLPFLLLPTIAQADSVPEIGRESAFTSALDFEDFASRRVDCDEIKGEASSGKKAPTSDRATNNREGRHRIGSSNRWQQKKRE